MEEFRKNFSLYSSVLCLTALWPYGESLLGKIQRVIVCLLIICLLAVQVSTLRMVELSLYNVLMMLSYSCPLTLFLIRYIGFAANRSVVRIAFDGFANDYNATKDPVELDIFAKHIIVARRVISVYLGVSSVLIAYLVTVILVPTLLRSKVQLQYLHIFGFFFSEMNHQTDWVSILFILVNVVGLLSIASTESALPVFSCYLCGLLEIASYRIEIAIGNTLQSTTTSDQIQIQSAVDLHKRALNLLNNLINDMILSYLAAIVLVIISFAVNLYRIAGDFSNLFFSFNDVLLHFVIMFLNNFSGQRLVNSSADVFNKICRSSWYCIPIRSQKILLFILMRSVNEVHCVLAGLYDVSYEGFSMMMSSSFSYFTVLCSTQ